MRRALYALAAGSAAVLAFVACEDDSRYVYTARKYDAVNGCLTDYKSIETVPGRGVSVRCPLACLTVDDAVYVSPVCPPLPSNAEALDESDPQCQAALDASAQEASCSGGATAPTEETDAGAEDAATE
jgi:hypothetical protein